MRKRAKRKRCTASESDEEDTCSSNDSDSVKQIGNRVFFYADVSTESVQTLYSCIGEANKHAIVSTPSSVHLHINSNGGDVYAGLAAYHHVRRNPIPIVTYVDGMVASAATLILMAGKRRVAMNHSFVLIHQVSTGFVGKYNEMIDEMANTHDLMDTFRDLYKKHTSISPKRLEKLLTSERSLDAKECLKEGIVQKCI